MEKMAELLAYRISLTSFFYAASVVVPAALLLGMAAYGIDAGYIAHFTLGILIVYFTLKRPYAAVIAFIVLLVLFSRSFAHMKFGGIFVTEFVLLLVLLSYWLRLNTSGRLLVPRYPLQSLFAVLYVISFYALCRGLVAYQDTQFVFRHAALFYYSLLYFIVPLVFDTMNKIRVLFYCYLAASVMIAAISICGGNVFGIHFSEFAYFHVSLALIFVFIHTVVNKRFSFVNLASITLFIYVVAQGMARSVWIGLCTAIAFVMIASLHMRVMRILLDRGLALLAILILCGSCGIFIMKPQYLSSIHSEAVSIVSYNRGKTVSDLNAQWRLFVWKDIIAETLQKPYFGWGFGRKFIPPTIQRLGWGGSWNDPAKRFQDPHNSFLSVFHRTGFVGLFLFVGILVAFIIRTCRSIMHHSDPEVRTYLLALLVCMLFIVGTANFMVLLEGPFLGVFLWIAMGLIVAIEWASSGMARQQKTEAAGER